MKNTEIKNKEIFKAEENAPKKYRIAARNLFLTYPRCYLDLEEVLSQIKYKFDTQLIREYLITRETAKEEELGKAKGIPHIHIYVRLTKIFSTYNSSTLDLKDKEGKSIKGDYQVAKKANAVIEYILKDIKSKGDSNMLFSDSISKRIDQNGNWTGFGESLLRLAEKGQIIEAMELYKKEKPLEYIKNRFSIEKSLRGIFMDKLGYQTKFDFKNYILPEKLKKFLADYNKNKTLVLIGPSGSGKTSFLVSWVKTFLGLEPLVINNLDALRAYREEIHEAIIYDDVPWGLDISREALLKFLDSEGPTTHSIKHSSIIVPRATPRFVITNDSKPFLGSSGTHYQDPAVTRRVVICLLDPETNLIPKANTKVEDGEIIEITEEKKI